MTLFSLDIFILLDVGVVVVVLTIQTNPRSERCTSEHGRQIIFLFNVWTNNNFIFRGEWIRFNVRLNAVFLCVCLPTTLTVANIYFIQCMCVFVYCEAVSRFRVLSCVKISLISLIENMRDCYSVFFLCFRYVFRVGFFFFVTICTFVFRRNNLLPYTLFYYITLFACEFLWFSSNWT